MKDNQRETTREKNVMMELSKEEIDNVQGGLNNAPLGACGDSIVLRSPFGGDSVTNALDWDCSED